MTNNDDRQQTLLKILDNGPIIVTGDFEIISIDSEVLEITDSQHANGISLCRCGKSKDMPFCDGSHQN